MKKPIYYALYKGDEFIDLGTKKYLADLLNVTIETLNFYMSKTYRKRNKKGNCYIVIRIEDD